MSRGGSTEGPMHRGQEGVGGRAASRARASAHAIAGNGVGQAQADRIERARDRHAVGLIAEPAQVLDGTVESGRHDQKVAAHAKASGVSA